ncbi:EGF domain-specific O-linked N-acetylglucosamine transferase [Diplonema papillatum]|nr:EGF domain-specific O-linked N-acetylglucosamine transferase [Diplonema papillatum]
MRPVGLVAFGICFFCLGYFVSSENKGRSNTRVVKTHQPDAQSQAPHLSASTPPVTVTPPVPTAPVPTAPVPTAPVPVHSYPAAPTTNLSAPGIAPYLVTPGEHETLVDAQCKKYVSHVLLDNWLKQERTLCDYTLQFDGKDWPVVAKAYAHPDLEYKPEVFVYENVIKTSLADTKFLTDCDKREYHGDPSQVMIVNETVYESGRFDNSNPFEAHHAYVNAYYTVRMFGVDPKELRIVLYDSQTVGGFDHEVWSVFAAAGRPGYPEYLVALKEKRPVLFRKMIRGQSSGTSLLVTNSGLHTPLHGRGSDHHCKSSLIHEFADWMKRQLLGEIYAQDILKPRVPKTDLKIVWSSRRPFLRSDGQHAVPTRMLMDEDKFLDTMRSSLPQTEITSIDFAQMKLLDVVRLMDNTDVVFGMHGAGLMWIVYLRRHSAVLEFFGADRGRNNRHYHNIASLADLHYDELSISRMACVSTCATTAVAKLQGLVAKVRSVEEPH